MCADPEYELSQQQERTGSQLLGALNKNSENPQLGVKTNHAQHDKSIEQKHLSITRFNRETSPKQKTQRLLPPALQRDRELSPEKLPKPKRVLNTPMIKPFSPTKLTKVYDWMFWIPPEYRRTCEWTLSDERTFNSGSVIILYAGAADDKDLESALRRLSPDMVIHSFDIIRNSTEDLLQPEPWNSLCTAASQGKLSIVAGGPNCRTWSIRRHFDNGKGAPPVRTREGKEVWGMREISPSEQQKVDQDNILLFRLMYLVSLSMDHNRDCGTFLEHPADPMWASRSEHRARCSSIWNTTAVQKWQQECRLNMVHFDQCRLGQVVCKTTSLATNLHLNHWNGLFCTSESHVQSVDWSSSLSRYPPQMMQGLAKAIRAKLQLPMALIPDHKLVVDADTDQLPRALNTSDRPEVLTWHHTSNLDENPVRVQVGFRFRPLRDGGGKPSPGIKPPHKRPTSKISHKGADILRLIQPWLPSLAQRLDSTSKEEMFTESQLEELRRTLSSQNPPSRRRPTVLPGSLIRTCISSQGSRLPVPPILKTRSSARSDISYTGKP